jgi:hypothetical protein
VDIQSIIPANVDVQTRRLMLANGVDIVWTYTQANGNATAIANQIRYAVNSGILDNSLRLAGYPQASAQPAAVTDTSPTAAPSQSSQPQGTSNGDDLTKEERDIAIGVAIGGFFFIMLVIGLIFFLFCRTASKPAEQPAPAYVQENSVPIEGVSPRRAGQLDV